MFEFLNILHEFFAMVRTMIIHNEEDLLLDDVGDQEIQ